MQIPTTTAFAVCGVSARSPAVCPSSSLSPASDSSSISRPTVSSSFALPTRSHHPFFSSVSLNLSRPRRRPRVSISASPAPVACKAAVDQRSPPIMDGPNDNEADPATPSFPTPLPSTPLDESVLVPRATNSTGDSGGGGRPPPSALSLLLFAALAGLAALFAATHGDALFAAWDAVRSDPHVAVSLGLGASAFIQTLTGFGFAIVSVSALTQLDWIANSSLFNDIQPIAATLSGAIAWLLVLPELPAVEWRRIAPVIAASTLLTPVGSIASGVVEGTLSLHILGALITAYVAFSVLRLPVPRALGGRAGAVVMGGLAGLFGGAFDISGPALVVHGQAAEWGESFRRNLLAIVGVNSTVVLLCDMLTGRLESFYYVDFLLYAAPGVVTAMLLGQFVSQRLDSSGFTKVVLGTCLVMGLRLLLT